MRVIYWNICLTTRPQPLFEHLMFLHQSLQGVDYFCLQEATVGLVDLFQKAGWQTFYMPNTSLRGILIVSKHALKKKRSYLLSSVIRKGRKNENYLILIESSWSNQPITIATTHLTYLRLREIVRRRRERKKLVKLLPKNNTLFGGDLNTIILPYAKWDIVQSGYISRVKGKTWCWHLKNTLRRIPFKLQLDYVFNTQDIHYSIRAKILREQKLSDHFPILVELG